MGLYSQMGGLIMENATKMDDLGVPPFMETSILLYMYFTGRSLETHSKP